MRMKKVSVAEENNGKTQGKEGSKLNRSSMQLANRVDIQLRSAVEWQDLFHPDAVVLRQRLRAQCESLILHHSKEYGRRAEERLWRKVFYDVIQKLRNHRKIQEGDTLPLDGVLRTHLSSAAGYYYHLLTHLQWRYHLAVDGILSWGLLSRHQAENQDEEVQSWAVKACQRCLIFLGDIARYQSDIEGEDAIKLAERFYSEAALINVDIGMPQNQLGTLAGTKAYGCEGAYFYLRCLLSKEVFDGAEGNLLRIFEKNRSILHRIKDSPEISSEDIGHLCQSVLQDFSSVLSVDPASSTPSHNSSLENGLIAAQENGGLEHDVTEDIDDVISSSLMVKLVVMAIAAVTRLQSKGSQESSVAIAFTLAFLSLLLQHCISSLEIYLAKEHSNAEHQAMNGPANAVLSHNGLNSEKLSKHDNSVTGITAQSNLNRNKAIKNVLKHRRRRRRRRNIDYSFDSYSGSGSDLEESEDNEEDEDSDLSEGGEMDGELEDLVSDEDDSEDVYVESESDEEGSNTGSLPKAMSTAANGRHLMKETQHKPADKSLCHQTASDKLGFRASLLGQNGISVGKVFRPDLFSDSLSSLWSRLAVLLNKFPSPEQMIVAVPLTRLQTWQSVLDEPLDKDWVQTRGLPEDMSLLGFTPLTAIHNRLDRKWSRLTRDCYYLEAAVRVQCLRSFGMKVASTQELSSFDWDPNTHQFVGPQQMAEREQMMAVDKRPAAPPVGDHDRRARVMKVMAQQLLQSEVAELESTLNAAPHDGPVYVVPDAMALCTQLHLVRRLIASEKLVVIIPIQVISALDDLKKYDSGAREATKFLEQEFKKGNRWIRAQKENETLDGQRRRGRYEDVAVWRFNQIVSCCRFFLRQTGKGLVTLLTGSTSYEAPKRGQRKGVTSSGTQATPEAVEFARSYGVNVESLRAFCARFSKQYKAVT
ncbi:hypothetical protein pdam_00000834 [Pocillopora damicornis]|uniref:PIN domain-containing protein n=1 Tax=Pocillopora damicornis TaxID=46731 RepID=A0A3M6TVC0_POCDA|nr:hypothetical protein pdam_00000834 [Pocillopora damicornis]